MSSGGGIVALLYGMCSMSETSVTFHGMVLISGNLGFTDMWRKDSVCGDTSGEESELALSVVSPSCPKSSPRIVFRRLVASIEGVNESRGSFSSFPDESVREGTELGEL